jgi:hypothetical protein
MLAISEVQNRIGEFSHKAMVRIIARDVTTIRKLTGINRDHRAIIRNQSQMIGQWETYADHLESIIADQSEVITIQSESIETLKRDLLRANDKIEFLNRALALPAITSEAHQNALPLQVTTPGNIPDERTITTRRGEVMTVKIARDDSAESIAPIATTTPIVASVPSESAGNSSSEDLDPESRAKIIAILVRDETNMTLSADGLVKLGEKIAKWDGNAKDPKRGDTSEYVKRIARMVVAGQIGTV